MATANPPGRLGGVGGGLIRRAVPYVATYVLGRKMGERGTRKRAGKEVREQRELGERRAREARDQLGRRPTGDYIRAKGI